MLQISVLYEAVKDVLGERFPGEMVYTNLTPLDFARPSFLLETESVQMADASRACLSVTANLKVTAFVVVNEYHDSHVEELLRRMLAVQELFAVGGLRVEDRVLHLTGNTGQSFFDFAEVKLKLDYQDDRPQEETWPLMETVQFKCEEGIDHGSA